MSEEFSFFIVTMIISMIGGILFGYCAIAEDGNDVINKDVLDSVCQELHGVGFKYQEANGIASDFICVGIAKNIVKEECSECFVSIVTK